MSDLKDTLSAFIDRNTQQLEFANALHIEIGKRVKERREALGLTQDELAHRCNMERTSFTMIETGRQGTPAIKLALFCVALNVTADYLLFGTEAKHD